MGGGDRARVDERGAERAERGSMVKGGCVGMVGGVWREEEEQRAVQNGHATVFLGSRIYIALLSVRLVSYLQTIILNQFFLAPVCRTD
jgi:hypothetical protein